MGGIIEMKKYTDPNLKITYFNVENIITASGAEDDVTADIKNYAADTVRLKQVEYNILEFKE